MAMNGDNLGLEIKAAILNLPYDPEKQNEGRGDMETLWKTIGNTIVQHVKDNMEIKGVTVQIPISTYINTVSGGSGLPAVGVPNLTPDTLSQNNDGTGRVE